MPFAEDGYGSFGGLVYPDIEIDDAQILIVGIPYEGGTSGNKGASFGPSAVRMISTDMQTMTRQSNDINSLILKEIGDLKIFPMDEVKTRNSIKFAYQSLFEDHSIPILTIGGDHSITFPIIDALPKQDEIGIIWFDAHRDLLDKLIESSYSHGSSLRRSIELKNIDPENVLLVGTRYMEAMEERFVQENNISEFTMATIEETNDAINQIILKIEEIGKRVKHLYVSIDIDILDPAFAPGTGTLVGGGMTTSQLMTIISKIPTKVRAYDIVEFAPPLDSSGITNKAILGIITEIFGQIKSYISY